MSKFVEWEIKILLRETEANEFHAWFKNQNETDTIKIIQKLQDENKYKWSICLIVLDFDRNNRVKFAIYCAKTVLHIFENKCLADDRPRKAIETSQEWLENPSKNSAAYKNKVALKAYAAFEYASDRAIAAAFDNKDDAAVKAAAIAAAKAASTGEAAAAHDAYNEDYDYTAYSYDHSCSDQALDAALYAIIANIKIKSQIIEYGIALLKEEVLA